MSRTRLSQLLFAVLVVGLPVAGWWARRDAGPRCDFDGLAIQTAFQVRIVLEEGEPHRFCCVHCAQQWLRRQESIPETVRVTDEPSGEEIDAGFAHFVHSSVVTDAVSGNRIHVFGDRTSAEEHARTFRGWLMTGPDRPFSMPVSSAEDASYPTP